MSSRKTLKLPRKSGSRPPSGSTTPGRPKESGSRQQTYPDQGAQTGSPELDEEMTRRGAPALPTKQSGGK